MIRLLLAFYSHSNLPSNIATAGMILLLSRMAQCNFIIHEYVTFDNSEVMSGNRNGIKSGTRPHQYNILKQRLALAEIPSLARV